MNTYMTKIQPDLNMRRFYQISVQSTLLGEHCVVRIYGRIGGSVNVLAPLECTSQDEALRVAQRLIKKRQRRGYEVQ